MRNRALWSILLVIFALPWDISSLIMSGISPTKFATVVTVGMVAWGSFKGPRGVFWRNNTLLWLPLLIPLAGLISLLGAWNLEAGGIEILRLLSLWALLVAFLWHVRPEDLQSISKLFAVVMLFTALFGLLQYASGHLLWGEAAGSVTRRANSTFIDPNIFARYLIVGILFVLTEIQDRTTCRGGPALMLLLLVLGVGVSFSRTGWADLVLTLGLFVVFSRGKRWKWLLGGIPAVALLGIAIPTVRSRLLTLQTDISAGRDYLWKAGYWMFHDHPWRGVGIGNFQTFFENHFMYLLNGSTITRSHTDLVTLAAEMGVIGLVLTGIVLAYIFWVAVSMLRRKESYDQPWLLAAVLGVLTIFISAQGEGRFFGDPLLWILIGYIGVYAREVRYRVEE
jgi:putative inorganic carbon (HCO3(-)) transporter